jgi:hypothetical protein
MSRPHEDSQRHTHTDHRAGGPAVAFAGASWWAIAVAHLSAERAPAGIAAHETLIEQARASAAKAHEAVVLESVNRRRVIALLHLDGHEAFKHINAAWDDHHLLAQRHAVAESHTVGLYSLALIGGDATVDPVSTDAYAFEHVLLGAQRTRAVVAKIGTAPGFRGAALFGADDDSASAILYRFEHFEEIEAFRATANGILGASAPGETFYQIRVVRTFT